MQRQIKYIAVHCTATPTTATVEQIQQYWKEKLCWKKPGYHYIIKRNGTIVNLLSETLIANGVSGYNSNAIHISYIGGIDARGNATDNRTAAQQQAMFKRLLQLNEKYPQAAILGHRDFPGVAKACPSFDVRKWLKTYKLLF
ncbi:N-acetylmuramoyl-L-alanine amidase [Niabella sp. 22666]|uniref:N-acetylmuramoyl-L-alanine amidase n=1 Tax=Niabella sp. 22666 TaxID=3453954 RepID=UPI003F826BBC